MTRPGPGPTDASARLRQAAALRKVPEVTAAFWAAKLLTTALGESASDALVTTVDPYLAVGGAFVLFAAALALQLRVRRYVPWVYWAAVAMVAVFGTMAADVLHVVLGVAYAASAAGFAAVLAAVFWLWHRSEGTLSIHSVTAGRSELFYWAAVCATFALGTAAGDLLAYTAGLGFLTAGIVFAALFAVPLLSRRSVGLPETAAFWLAYILTRPLGASFADWAGKGPEAGGLGWGDGPVAAALLLLTMFVVGGLQRRQVQTSS